MALIKWFPKARATAVKGSPANWSINSADSQGSRGAPQLQFLGNNVQINCKQIKLQLQAAERRLAGSQERTCCSPGPQLEGEGLLPGPSQL